MKLDLFAKLLFAAALAACQLNTQAAENGMVVTAQHLALGY